MRLNVASGRRPLIVAILVCSLGLSIGVVVWLLRAANAPVVLEPRKVVLVGDFLEGEMASIDLVLRNDSNREMSVLGTGTSCGCAEMKSLGGEPLPRGFPLLPGAVVPWQVDIATGNAGTKESRVMVQCEDNGRVISVTSEIEIRVRASTRVHPTILDFGEVPVGQVSEQKKFVLVDAIPDPGTEITKCTSSAPDRLSIELERVDHEESTLAEGAAMKIRYRGRVSCNPQKKDYAYHDWITLFVRRGQKEGTVRVPVIYRTGGCMYTLSPSNLIFTRTRIAQEYHRRLVCTLGPGAGTSLKVLSKPENVQIEIRDMGASTKAIDVTCVAPPANEACRDSEVRFGVSDDTEPVCLLPIRFLGVMEKQGQP